MATVNLYADNRRACTCTASGGTSTTVFTVAAFSSIDATIFTSNTDLVDMGLHVTGGTGSGANPHRIPYKITAVDNTVPAAPIITVTPAMAATPTADWTFAIFYGSGLNTGASQTKGAGTTGPVNEINYAISSSALSATDVGHVHIRGNTGQNYTNTYGSFDGFGLHYTNSFGSTKTFILEGYVTAIQDLAPLANKTSTYFTASRSNPDDSVDSSAGAQLYADTALTAQFPKLRFGYSNGGFVIGDPAHASPSMTLRCVDYRNASTTGTSSVIQVAPTTTSVSVTIDRCIIGSLETTDDNASAVNIAGTGVVSTATVSISKSVILGRRYGITAINLLGLTVDQTYIENYGKDKDGAQVNGIYCLKVDNNTAAAYSAAMLPTNQVRRLTVTDNNMVHTATHSAASTTTVGIQVLKSVEMELCKIRKNNLLLYSRASGILISGCSALDVQRNRVRISNATTHGVAIGIGADAAVEPNPTGDTLLLVASGTNDANGSQVAADGGTPLALPAHSTFKLTGGSATDDVYNGMVVWKIDTTSKVEKSVIWDYDGTTKIAKCTPQFGTTVASGVKWEVYRPRIMAHGVVAHNFVNSLVSPGTTSHAFGLFQGCDHIDFYNNTAIGYFDNGIVLKGEYNRVINNRVYAGRGTLLIKGGSFNDVRYNTFYCANANGGTGCFDIQDKSNVHNMASGEAPLSASHYSKAQGNRVTDNIFIVDSANNTLVFNDNATGAGSWLGAASSYPLGQANLVDYNIYHQAHASAALGSMNGSSVAHGASIATVQAAWAAYSTALQYGATNDANSSVGTITLASPSTGDFTVIGGTARWMAGSDGAPVGASRQPVGLTVGSMQLLGVGG